MRDIIPQIGMCGLYKLRSPFDASLVEGVQYTCIAVRRLSDIAAAGGDPQGDYYSAAAIDTAKYLEDVAAGTCIISLQNASGKVNYVPSSYVLSFPDMGGLPYTSVMLAVSLGQISDSIDLTYVKSKIHDVVLENVGIESTVNTVVVSATTIVGHDNHRAIEAARANVIGTVTTDHSKYLKAVAERDSAYGKIQILESFIKKLKTDGII